MMYASEMAAQILGGIHDRVFLPHKGKDTYCTFCGRPIRQGDPMESVAGLNEFFSDTRSLACYSAVSCPYCAVVRTRDNMFKLMRVVVTERAIFPIAKDVHKAWLLLTPPEPPFAVMIGTSTLQHLVWRTPVTLSRDLIYIRLGNQVVTVRPRVLAAAKNLVQSLAQEKKFLLSVDREMKTAFHGRIRHDIWSQLNSSDQNLIASLTPGEIWGLSIVATKSNPQPEVPQPIATL